MRLTIMVGAGVVAAAMVGTAAAKGPPVPPGQWAVDYAKDVCILSRDGLAGEPGIAIRTRFFASEHDLLLYLPRTGEKERWFKGQLAIDGRPVGVVRGIAIGEPQKARKLIDTRISADELAAIARARSIRLSGDGRLDVTATLPRIAKAMAALRTCEVDLAGRWGVAPSAMRSWSRTVLAETDLRALFWDRDVRKSVILRTPVRALLDVDERGAVTGCRITQSSRVSWVDQRFCATLRADARFSPALDLAGRPVRGQFVTPAITSALMRR